MPSPTSTASMIQRDLIWSAAVASDVGRGLLPKAYEGIGMAQETQDVSAEIDAMPDSPMRAAWQAIARLNPTAVKEYLKPSPRPDDDA